MEEIQQENSSHIYEWFGRIETALREQQNVLNGILQDTKRIKRYIFWGRMFSLFYVLLIIAPIVLAILYLPPLLRQYTEVYQQALETFSSQSNAFSELQRRILQENGH